jgi:hypothetical protein
MHEIMEELFPRKTTVLTREDAEEGIPELVAFWRYLGREYKLPQADGMIRYLERIAPRFPDMMFDPSRYGMAKSILMAGQEAGYDMTDPKSADAFIAYYNARRTAEIEGIGPLRPSSLGSTLSRAEQARRKRQRKAARSARRRQRK